MGAVSEISPRRSEGEGMNFDFGNVLTRAWQIIWKHKVLWIFGIFAGCARGGGSGGGGGGGGNRYETDNAPPFADQRVFDQIGQWIEQNWWVIVLFVIILILLVLLAVFLGAIGRIGLIRGTYQAEAGVERLAFGTLFQESLPYFWRVFGLLILIGLAFLAIFIPIVLFGVLTGGVGFACLLPLICVLIPVSWAVVAVLEQATAAIVIEDVGIADGVRRGWEVCKSNVGTIIVMALILWIGSLVVGLLIAIPVFLAVLPAIIGLIANQGTVTTTPFVIAGLCFVAYLPVLIVLSGILTAYVQSAWALTYMRLAKPKENAPVITAANA